MISLHPCEASEILCIAHELDETSKLTSINLVFTEAKHNPLSCENNGPVFPIGGASQRVAVIRDALTHADSELRVSFHVPLPISTIARDISEYFPGFVLRLR